MQNDLRQNIFTNKPGHTAAGAMAFILRPGKWQKCFAALMTLTIIVGSGFLGALSAQQDSVTTLAFGFGGGVFANQIQLSNTLRQEYDIEPLNGVHVGASIRYFQNKAVGFVGELNYSEGGWQESVDTVAQNYQRKISYLELQILTQLAIGRKFIRPILQAGPYVSVPIGQSELLPERFPQLEEEYYGEGLPFRINYGLAVGTGLYLAIGPIGLQLEGRVLLGVSDLVRSGTFGVTTSRRQALGGRVTVFYELASAR